MLALRRGPYFLMLHWLHANGSTLRELPLVEGCTTRDILTHKLTQRTSLERPQVPLFQVFRRPAL